jgi:dihydroneopterin aldolase
MINSASIVTAGRFQLQVSCYRLWLSVGWTEAERETPQPIDIDLSITLEAAPMATKTDRLEDTFCYATLLNTLATTSQAKSFKLLEHLAAVLVRAGEQFLCTQGYYSAVISVSVTKVCPPVRGVLGGIRVLYHNMPLSQPVTPCLSQ